RHLVPQDAGAEPDAAELVAHGLGVPRLRPCLARREVHAQELAGVAAGQRRDGRLRSGALGGRGRAHRVATDWGSEGEWEGRPSTVLGSSAAVVRWAMKAGLTSKGSAARCRFHAERSTPVCTSPFRMPTSFVVQMSLEGPQIMAPVSRPPRKRSFRYWERAGRVPVKTSAPVSSHWPNEATSRWHTSTMFMRRLPR